MRELGWRLSVTTSKPTVFADRILEHFALGDYFAGSLWTSIFMLQKHNLFGVPPEIVLMALFAWGIIKLAQK